MRAGQQRRQITEGDGCRDTGGTGGQAAGESAEDAMLGDGFFDAFGEKRAEPGKRHSRARAAPL